MSSHYVSQKKSLFSYKEFLERNLKQIETLLNYPKLNQDQK